MKNRPCPGLAEPVAYALFGLVAPFLSSVLADEPFIQADVYDALFQAYIDCDDNFGQRRSEFITEKLRNDAGRISMASLRKILRYKVDLAKQEISEKMAQRAFFLSGILEADDQSADQPGDKAEKRKESHDAVREIDAFVKEKRRYVDLHECVLETL